MYHFQSLQPTETLRNNKRRCSPFLILSEGHKILFVATAAGSSIHFYEGPRMSLFVKVLMTNTF